MEITDIECREFTVVKRGYDPDEVRSFLKDLAEAGLKPSPVFSEVGDQIAEASARATQLVTDAEAIAANVAAESERTIAARREAADVLLRERATTDADLVCA